MMRDEYVIDGAVKLVFHSRRAKLRTALLGYIGLLESYFEGEIELQGDLARALSAAMATHADTPNLLVRLANRWNEIGFSRSGWEGSRRYARAHYGFGESFYKLWLDEPLMMYTCGYWKEGTRSLEEAQRDKVEHICRKLRIEPGDRVLDIGCGFGGFMFHAQREHGAKVTGINTTPEQVASVRDQIGSRNLQGSIEVVESDFRQAASDYDKVVSIGVLEHAGKSHLDEVVRAHAAPLRSGGLGMLHFIGHVSPAQTDFFIRKHIFPGGWIPALGDVLVAMERAGLEVLDVENLRRHYALTLEAWAHRFDRNWTRIHALDPLHFDERFRRIWRTYLYGCAEMFRSPAQRTHLFQIVFSKGNATADSYPMTRDFMYAAPRGPVAADVRAAS